MCYPFWKSALHRYSNYRIYCCRFSDVLIGSIAVLTSWTAVIADIVLTVIDMSNNCYLHQEVNQEDKSVIYYYIIKLIITNLFIVLFLFPASIDFIIPPWTSWLFQISFIKCYFCLSICLLVCLFVCSFVCFIVKYVYLLCYLIKCIYILGF